MTHQKFEAEGLLTGPMVKLAPRECELLRCVCQGKKDRQIAEEMGISVGSVGQYLVKMYRDLRASGRQELRTWGLQYPGAMKGEWTPRNLHPPGCCCDAVYCTAMRLGSRDTRKAA